jgi:2-haloacid dehalogenase
MRAVLTANPASTGWESARIRGAGNDVLEVGPQPQIVGGDLTDVAEQLIARHKLRC